MKNDFTKNENEDEPLEQQLEKLIKKKSEENQALSNLFRNLEKSSHSSKNENNEKG
jgi:hypothetical protein